MWGLTTKCVLLFQHHNVGLVEIGGELYESLFNIDMDGFGNPRAKVSVISSISGTLLGSIRKISPLLCEASMLTFLGAFGPQQNLPC